MTVLRDSAVHRAYLWSRGWGSALPFLFLLPLFLSGCATRAPSPSFDRAVRVAGEERGVYLREVPFYPAQPDDAHDVVWAMVMDYWRSPEGWTRWRPGWREMQVDLARPIGEVEVHLRAYDLWAFAGQSDWLAVQARLRAGVPPIMALQAPLKTGEARYPALLVGYDDVRQRALVYGTRGTPEEMTYEELFDRWQRAQQWMWTICPPERAEWWMSDDELAGRGRYYAAQDRLAEAERDFNLALEREPGQPLYYIELADTYLRRADYRQAEPLYRAALELAPDHARGLNNLAYLLIRSGGDLDEAVRLARKATVLEPHNPRLLDTLGVALHRRGELDEAARVLQRARTRAMWMDNKLQAMIALHLVQVYHDADLWHLARQTLADAMAHDADLVVPDDLRIHLRPSR